MVFKPGAAGRNTNGVTRGNAARFNPLNGAVSRLKHRLESKVLIRARCAGRDATPFSVTALTQFLPGEYFVHIVELAKRRISEQEAR